MKRGPEELNPDISSQGTKITEIALFQPRKKRKHLQKIEQQDQENPMGYLSNNHDTLMSLIFAYLSPKEILLQAGMVCKHWYRLAKDEYIWKQKIKEFFSYALRNGQPKTDLPYDEQFKRLYRRPQNDVTSQEESMIFSQNSPHEAVLEVQSTILSQNLPEEIIINIFSHLRPKELGEVQRVCKEWHSLAQDKMIWRNKIKQFFQLLERKEAEVFIKNPKLLFQSEIEAYKESKVYKKKLLLQSLEGDFEAIDRAGPNRNLKIKCYAISLANGHNIIKDKLEDVDEDKILSTALFYAALDNNLDSIENCLVKYEMRDKCIKQRCEKTKTQVFSALNGAIVAGHLDLLMYLIKELGIEFSREDYDNLLMSAFENNQLELFQFILTLFDKECLAEIEEKWVVNACVAGCLNFVKYLRARMKISDETLKHLLAIAVTQGYSDIVEYLFENEALGQAEIVLAIVAAASKNNNMIDFIVDKFGGKITCSVVFHVINTVGHKDDMSLVKYILGKLNHRLSKEDIKNLFLYCVNTDQHVVIIKSFLEMSGYTQMNENIDTEGFRFENPIDTETVERAILLARENKKEEIAQLIESYLLPKQRFTL